jgi:hypothetical protein
MAVIARRGWSSVKAEVIRRLKGISSTGFDTRVEYWIQHAYLQLTTLYHHHELDRSTTLTLSTATNSVALPADCYIACSATLRNVGNTAIVESLVFANPLVLRRDYKLTPAGQPKRWTRWGSTIQFDRLPDLAYRCEFDYYATPTAPDFSTASLPETAWDCDEALIQWALALAKPEISVPSVERELFSSWLAEQPRPSTLDSLVDVKERSNTARPRGGAQG